MNRHLQWYVNQLEQANKIHISKIMELKQVKDNVDLIIT